MYIVYPFISTTGNCISIYSSIYIVSRAIKNNSLNIVEDPDFDFTGNDYSDEFCEPPNNITNGYYEPLDEFYDVYSNVTYFCDEGYKLNGYPGPYNCTEETVFDIDEYPSCEG